MNTITFFNNKGGVGKTSLVYHLAWMFADRGIPVLAVDLDPQSNLTSMFLNENHLAELWSDDEQRKTIFGSVQPILKGTGDIGDPSVEALGDKIRLIPGDLGLSRFEDKLSDAWPRCHNKDESAFRTTTAFHRIIQKGAQWGAHLVLIDVGPNLGAINRAALVSADHVIVPVSADLFSLQGLRNLGPTLRDWRDAWQDLKKKSPQGLSVPNGTMAVSGYIVSQHGVKNSRPVKAYMRWLERMPEVYRNDVLGESYTGVIKTENDPYALAHLKHYRSLMPMAMEARKPMFSLRPADGAIGAHVDAVKNCYDDFYQLAVKIGEKVGLKVQ